MIGAAGAIYVIGGFGGGVTYYKDVWVSTDGGADRTRGVLDWYLRALEGTFVVHRGYSWYSRGVEGVLSCTQWVLSGYSGTHGVLLGYSVGTQEEI